MRRLALVVLMLTGGVMLTGCAWVRVAMVGVATISVDEARAKLASGSPLVVDLRDRAAYEAGHVAEAVNVNLDDLEAFLGSEPAPHGRTAVAICYHGNLSLAGAATLAAHGYTAFSLAGGMEAWIAKGLPVETGPGASFHSSSGLPPPTPLSRLGEVAVTLNGYLIKPTHMLLSLALIVLLWRVRGRDLVLLRRAFVVFLAGESFCAMNYLVAGDRSFVLKLLHDLGMVGFGALLPLAVFELADARFLRLTRADAACALTRLCGQCAKRSAARCGLVDAFRAACVVLAVLAAMPFTLPLRPVLVTWRIFGTEVVCTSPFGVMLTELRLFPLAAVALLVWAALRLGRGRDGVRGASLPFFLGLGLAVYALTRFVLVETYRAAPAWSLVWEEVTELLTVGSTAWVLFAFRRPLGIVAPWRRARAEVQEVG